MALEVFDTTPIGQFEVTTYFFYDESGYPMFEVRVTDAETGEIMFCEETVSHVYSSELHEMAIRAVERGVYGALRSRRIPITAKPVLTIPDELFDLPLTADCNEGADR